MVSQQKTIIKKLKTQRKELLDFYKKHKKYELREAQIENQKSLLEKVESKYIIEANRAAELQEIDNEIENSPDFKGNVNSNFSERVGISTLANLKSSGALRNATMYKDIQIKKLQQQIDQNRLLIFMQEKLAEMKSKYMTKVAIRVKPVPDSLTLQQPTADDDEQ